MIDEAAGRKILVVGGGAAGMMAAIIAARAGGRVVVVERMQRVGRKLLATGNGRCNLTNLHAEDARHYHGSDPAFVQPVLSDFGVSQTINFFENLGILTRVESDGKVFPRCDQASSVLDVLRFEMEALGVEMVCDVRIQRVEGRSGNFRCLTTDGRELKRRAGDHCRRGRLVAKPRVERRGVQDCGRAWASNCDAVSGAGTGSN